MEDPGGNKMRMKYTCTYLPNKVGSCPSKTFFNSTVSGPVHKWGMVENKYGVWVNIGEDWGSHELKNMASRHHVLSWPNTIEVTETAFLQTVHCPGGLLSSFEMKNIWQSGTLDFLSTHYFKYEYDGKTQFMSIFLICSLLSQEY